MEAVRLAYMTEWGNRIALRIKETGVSQAAVARACKVSGASVNDWVSGKTLMIDGINLVRVARKLQTSPEWIMTGRGDPDGKATAVSLPDPDLLFNAETLVLGQEIFLGGRGFRFPERERAVRLAHAYAYVEGHGWPLSAAKNAAFLDGARRPLSYPGDASHEQHEQSRPARAKRTATAD